MATPGVRVLDVLSRDKVRSTLIGELKELSERSTEISREAIGVILGQWYHPLHYFPVYLSRLISVSPTLEAQTFVSRILWQELGQGDPSLAHETLFTQTMTNAGFDRRVVASSAPFDATAKLVRGYEKASANYLSGIGYLYGTEVVDLSMVSTVGKLVGNSTGKRDLPWVDIHIEQEPDHVDTSSKTLMPAFSPDEQAQIVSSAEELWTGWAALFKEAKERVL